MNKLMELIFILSGHVVGNTNGVIAILFIGLLPVYLYGLICYKNKISIRGIVPIIFLLLAIILSVSMSAVFAITAVALGAWG